MAVYFIKDESTGFVKIGYSEKPKNRLKNLQTSSANKLTLVHAVEGNKNLESALHTRFATHKVRGEWFSLPNLDEVIASANLFTEGQTQSPPDHLLPLADAARSIGKSVDTLRRWKRTGLLAFHGPDEQGRVLVQKSALLLATQGHARDTAPRGPQSVKSKEAIKNPLNWDLNDLVKSYENQIKSWKKMCEENEEKKEKAQAALEEARSELKEERKRQEEYRVHFTEQMDRLRHQRDELEKKTPIMQLLAYALKFRREGKL